MMFTIEYNDIILLWHGEPPANRVLAERVIRSDLRRHVLPMKPTDLTGHFVNMVAMGGFVYVFGQDESDAFHCTYFP